MATNPPTAHEVSARQTLLAERARLDVQDAHLRAEQERLEGSGDVEALRVQGELLHTHHEQLAAFRAGLEAFHSDYGPLDPPEDRTGET